jgi:hypothetical protein
LALYADVITLLMYAIYGFVNTNIQRRAHDAVASDRILVPISGTNAKRGLLDVIDSTNQ